MKMFLYLIAAVCGIWAVVWVSIIGYYQRDLPKIVILFAVAVVCSVIASYMEKLESAKARLAAQRAAEAERLRATPKVK